MEGGLPQGRGQWRRAEDAVGARRTSSDRLSLPNRRDCQDASIYLFSCRIGSYDGSLHRLARCARRTSRDAQFSSAVILLRNRNLCCLCNLLAPELDSYTNVTWANEGTAEQHDQPDRAARFQAPHSRLSSTFDGGHDLTRNRHRTSPGSPPRSASSAPRGSERVRFRATKARQIVAAIGRRAGSPAQAESRKLSRASGPRSSAASKTASTRRQRSGSKSMSPMGGAC